MGEVEERQPSEGEAGGEEVRGQGTEEVVVEEGMGVAVGEVMEGEEEDLEEVEMEGWLQGKRGHKLGCSAT